MSLTSCIQDVLWLKKFPKILGEVLDEATAERLFHVSSEEGIHACIADAKNQYYLITQSW